MVTLEDMKKYLRVDGSDEDDLITSLIESAEQYIINTTGKTNNGSALYLLCEKIFVAHWYENRGIVGEEIELPQAGQALLTHIKLSDAYPEAAS